MQLRLCCENLAKQHLKPMRVSRASCPQNCAVSTKGLEHHVPLQLGSARKLVAHSRDGGNAAAAPLVLRRRRRGHHISDARCSAQTRGLAKLFHS
eukprot:6195677-Pleurochrysis_carterae.AAC.3